MSERARAPAITGRRAITMTLALITAACGPASAILDHAGNRESQPSLHVIDEHAPAIGPLADDDRRVLFASPADDPPPVLGGVTKDMQGRHYLTSNERSLQAFEPHVRERGGAYLGVGTDQAYLMIGWARSEFAWLVDYDPLVVDMHGVYRALLLAAQTPEEFLALWSRAGRIDAHAAIDEHADGPDRARLRTLYRQQRSAVARRLGETLATMNAAGVPCWLGDPAQYEHVRELVQHGRTRAMLVDLSADKGLAGIARAARKAGLEIRVVYLSNAEEYWRLYPESFRRDLADLPMPDDAVVLRTLLIWKINRDYRYNVQRADNLRAWLAQSWVGNVYHITYARPDADPLAVNSFETTVWPSEAPSALRNAARRKIRELVEAGHGVHE
jgi:hypothetical protein